jgi:hypothetical protein
VSRKSFKDELKELGLTKSRLADELELSSEQVSRWKDEPPGYARAYLAQLRKNKLIQQKLDSFMRADKDGSPDEDLSAAHVKAFSHIEEVVPKNQSAIVLFTRGLNLEFRENATGYSGNWVLDPEKHFDKVVIYLRKENAPEAVNEIHIADFIWSEGPVDDRRYRVHFKNLVELGITHKNWKEFTDAGVNPVKYFNL